MIIFNNGKYKSILAAEKGELAEIAETVQKTKIFDRTIILPHQLA